MHQLPGVHARAAYSTRRMGSRVAVLAAAGALLVACTPTLAPRHRALRQELQTVSAPAPSAAEPDEDLFLADRSLQRAALIRAVLERNPSVRAAESAFRAALARFPQVTALADPVLGYGVAPKSFGSSTVNDAHKVELSQHLPFPGKLRLRGQAALAEAEASRHTLDSVRLELATAASHLYDDYYLLARSIELNSEHVALLEDLKRIATAHYEAGQGSQQDPLQAETELAHLIHRGVVLATAKRIATQQLNTLLHRPPGRSLPPAPALLSTLIAPPDLEQSVEQALAVHPELRASWARVESKRAAVSHARREFLPDFTLHGAYNSLWQADDLQPFIGLSLNVPLQLAKRRAALAEARAELTRAEALRTSVEDRVRLGVESAFERLREARHVEQLFRDRLLPPAVDRVQAARAGFVAGRDSFLVLIDAERNLRTTELGLEEARANASRTHTELLRARGELPGGIAG